MRVTRLVARRYGRWCDLDLGGLDQAAPLVFLGANEAGKTSLAAFVLDMLMGFSVSTLERHVYAPWSGGTLEGSLEFETHDGCHGRVTRSLGARADGDWVDGGQAHSLGNAPLPTLADWDRPAFEAFLCLNADEMSRVGEAGVRRLETCLLFGGAGKKRSPRHQADAWDAEARRLWRKDRRGKPLARRIEKELQSAESLILDLTERRRAAGEIRRRMRRIEEEVRALEEELEILDERRRESLERRAELQAWLRLQEEDGSALARLGRELALREQEVSHLAAKLPRSDILKRWREVRPRLRPRPDWSRRLKRWRDEARGWGERVDKGAHLWGLELDAWRALLDGLTEEDLRHVRQSGRSIEHVSLMAALLGIVFGGGLMAAGHGGEGALVAGALLTSALALFQWGRSVRFRPLGGPPATLRLRRASAAWGFLDAMTVFRRRERDLSAEIRRLEGRRLRVRGLRRSLARSLGLPSERRWKDLEPVIASMARRLNRLQDARRRIADLRRGRADLRERLLRRRPHIRSLRRWLAEESVTRRWLSLREKKDEREMVLRALRAELAGIGDDGGLDDLERRRARLTASLEEVRRRSFRLRMQAAVLREACDRVAGDRSALLMGRTAEWASVLTGGRVAGVFALNDDESGGGMRLAVQGSHPGSIRPVATPLSRGLVEQIWFAWRLAHAEELDPKGACPLVLDETFACWDPQRVARAAKLLAEISRTRQVFLFTCRPAVADTFRRHGRARIIRLDHRRIVDEAWAYESEDAPGVS